MKIWIVLDTGNDLTSVMAVYQDKELADEHVRLMGGYAHETDILSALHPDAVDPVKQHERAEAIAHFGQQCMEQREHWKRYDEMIKAMRPDARMLLCKCQTFTVPNWTSHGYCSYCGGFSPSTYREYLGEEQLQRAIDKFVSYDRDRMREIVMDAVKTTEGVE